jgi:hypothetical protein
MKYQPASERVSIVAAVTANDLPKPYKWEGQ